MILDKIEFLSKYEPIVHEITKLDSLLPMRVQESDLSFEVNKDNTTLYVVKKGVGVFTTTWRENLLSEEVTAVVKAEEGFFVLYLPGEPVLVKLEEGAHINKYNLE